MITPNTLKILSAHKHSSFKILSVYLGDEGLRPPTGELLLTQFHSLIHSHLDKFERELFADDIVRIQNYFKDYEPTSRSVIFFSAGEKVWQVVHLEFYIEQHIVIGNSPYIAPIDSALDEYSMYLVLLVDREKVRMFTVEQGELVDSSEVTVGYVPQASKSTGRDAAIGRSDINFRHNEIRLRRHIELTALEIAKFTKNKNIRFVILGGHSELFKRVADSLPVGLRRKILERFVTDVNIPINEIMLESKQIAASLSVS